MLITNLETNVINKQQLVNVAKDIIRLHTRNLLEPNEIELITSLNNIKQTNINEVTIEHDNITRIVFDKSIALVTDNNTHTRVFIEFDTVDRYKFNLIIYSVSQ